MEIKMDRHDFKHGHKATDVKVTVSGADAPDLLHFKFLDISVYWPGETGSNPAVWMISDYDAKSSTVARISVTPPLPGAHTAHRPAEGGHPPKHPLGGSTGTLILTGQNGGTPQAMPPISGVTVS